MTGVNSLLSLHLHPLHLHPPGIGGVVQNVLHPQGYLLPAQRLHTDFTKENINSSPLRQYLRQTLRSQDISQRRRSQEVGGVTEVLHVICSLEKRKRGGERDLVDKHDQIITMVGLETR